MATPMRKVSGLAPSCFPRSIAIGPVMTIVATLLSTSESDAGAVDRDEAELVEDSFGGGGRAGDQEFVAGFDPAIADPFARYLASARDPEHGDPREPAKHGV